MFKKTGRVLRRKKLEQNPANDFVRFLIGLKFPQRFIQ